MYMTLYEAGAPTLWAVRRPLNYSNTVLSTGTSDSLYRQPIALACTMRIGRGTRTYGNARM